MTERELRVFAIALGLMCIPATAAAWAARRCAVTARESVSLIRTGWRDKLSAIATLENAWSQYEEAVRQKQPDWTIPTDAPIPTGLTQRLGGVPLDTSRNRKERFLVDGICYPGCEVQRTNNGAEWGWENGASCLFRDSPRAVSWPVCEEKDTRRTPTRGLMVDGTCYPRCQTPHVAGGFDWGWENGASCVLIGSPHALAARACELGDAR